MIKIKRNVSVRENGKVVGYTTVVNLVSLVHYTPRGCWVQLKDGHIIKRKTKDILSESVKKKNSYYRLDNSTKRKGRQEICQSQTPQEIKDAIAERRGDHASFEGSLERVELCERR